MSWMKGKREGGGKGTLGLPPLPYLADGEEGEGGEKGEGEEDADHDAHHLPACTIP